MHPTRRRLCTSRLVFSIVVLGGCVFAAMSYISSLRHQLQVNEAEHSKALREQSIKAEEALNTALMHSMEESKKAKKKQAKVMASEQHAVTQLLEQELQRAATQLQKKELEHAKVMGDLRQSMEVQQTLQAAHSKQMKEREKQEKALTKEKVDLTVQLESLSSELKAKRSAPRTATDAVHQPSVGCAGSLRSSKEVNLHKTLCYPEPT